MCESSGRISRSTASRHAAGEPGREKIDPAGPDARLGARQHRRRPDLLVGEPPEQLAEPRQPLLQQGVDRLERLVAGRDPRAAREDHRLDAGMGAGAVDHRVHLARLVPHDLVVDHLVPGAEQELPDRAARSCRSRASWSRRPCRRRSGCAPGRGPCARRRASAPRRRGRSAGHGGGPFRRRDTRGRGPPRRGGPPRRAPRRRARPASWRMQPGFAVTTVVAPVAATWPSFRASSRCAIAGLGEVVDAGRAAAHLRLAELDQLEARARRAGAPGASARTCWPCARWHGSWYVARSGSGPSGPREGRLREELGRRPSPSARTPPRGPPTPDRPARGGRRPSCGRRSPAALTSDRLHARRLEGRDRRARQRPRPLGLPRVGVQRAAAPLGARDGDLRALARETAERRLVVRAEDRVLDAPVEEAHARAPRPLRGHHLGQAAAPARRRERREQGLRGARGPAGSRRRTPLARTRRWRPLR